MSSDSLNAGTGKLVDKTDVLTAAAFSVCSLAIAGESIVTLWHGVELATDTSPQGTTLRISPDRPAIIGRAEGNEIYYLDPAYRPTRLVPGTGQNIMRANGHDADRYVSRGHFMLRAAGRGVLLVNGVPRPGGGLRPPLNGTRLLVPERRPMSAGEEFLIASGATAVIVLPNGAEVLINAA